MCLRPLHSATCSCPGLGPIPFTGVTCYCPGCGSIPFSTKSVIVLHLRKQLMFLLQQQREVHTNLNNHSMCSSSQNNET
ncbi:hypothetical protein UPYG_G00331000 [Umbra pygmaea]|uniref:Uncharacterized protein n=1 Tax=Umbra pygmaea TaxID=75934 RepID=A0ABD0WBH7_UMBPY